MAFQNFFATRLATDIGAADAVIQLETVPTATSGRLALEARNSTQREIIKYTGVAGNTITGVTRGQGGTTAKSHVKNALVEMNATAEDLQELYDAFASFSATNGSGWYASTAVLSGSPTYNGNRSYSFNTTVDQSSLWSPGTRLRLTRTVAAPTQSTLLNGTTQYYNDTSVNGMSFTDDFTASAWIKLSNYSGGADMNIISRYNGTSGWRLCLNGSGQLLLIGHNAANGNFRFCISYQSVPLNKWVHVAAFLDMSGFTYTNDSGATNSYVMMDGVVLPGYMVQGGTTPASIVQAGNLEVGAAAGASPFPGKIAQAAIYSARVTPTVIRNTISQGLIGNETNLISAYSFNNSLNDLNTTNANNLTAQGSAVATNADSPFGIQGDGSISATLTYGIVQAINGTSVTIQVPEGCTLPTSGGFAITSYSVTRAPYRFPLQNDRWQIKMLILQSVANPGGAGGLTVYNAGGLNLLVPVGAWDLRGELAYDTNPNGTTAQIYAGLSTSFNSWSDRELGEIWFQNGIASNSLNAHKFIVGKAIQVSTPTPYYPLYASGVALNSVGNLRGNVVAGTPEYSFIQAENKLL